MYLTSQSERNKLVVVAVVVAIVVVVVEVFANLTRKLSRVWRQ